MNDVLGIVPVTVGDLPLVGTSILVLLGLSSHRARDYAARDDLRHVLRG